MKRLIIEGDWVLRKSSQGEYWCIDVDATRVSIAWPDQPGVTVEDIPDPLPTEPGTRFWGSYDKTKSCWWFVMADPRDGSGVRYVSQYGIGDGHPSGVHSSSIVATEGRLVRLPDPEVTQ